MNTLIIRLNSISGPTCHIDETVEVRQIQPEGATDLSAETVRIVGDLVAVGSDFLFQGNLEADFIHECDRCLEMSTFPVSTELCWNFEQDPAGALREAGIDLADDGDLADSAIARPIVNDEIALGPHIWEELALSAPEKFVCRASCLGLCPRCGVNLNVTNCNCEEDARPGLDSIRGLAGLAEKFPDLAPKKKTEE